MKTKQKAIRIPLDELDWLEQNKGTRRGVATFINEIVRDRMNKQVRKTAKKKA